MNDRWTRWLVCGALACDGGAIGLAADSVVQDFDGWRITIQPGDFPVAAGAKDHVPPAPIVFSTTAGSQAQAEVRLVSLQTSETVEQSKPVAPAPQPHADDLPVIVPGECCDKAGVVSVDPPAGRVDPRYLSQMYSEVYQSIPFIRAEYNANPSYLHDATMEFLFGQMRPTVIHRGTTNVNHHYPDYGYGFNRYAYPPFQVVVPGIGLRVHRSNNRHVE